MIDVQSRDLRDWSKGKHREADDRPFGGGAGMVLKPEPLFDAIEELSTPQTTVVYMAPDGEKFTTELAKEFSQNQHLVLVSGHYEGIDQRVRDQLVDREVSIGDYVLTNGALAASVLIDAVARHVPGVLGDEESLQGESFEDDCLVAPSIPVRKILEDLKYLKYYSRETTRRSPVGVMSNAWIKRGDYAQTWKLSPNNKEQRT